MKITLMRHGKPVLAKTGWVAPVEMAHWIECYQLSEVAADGVPHLSLALANSATCIVASTARRALSSVQVLGQTVRVTDAVFGEAELPFALWRFPRLPPFVWAAIFRMLWLVGYSRGADSIQATKARARAAAHQLIALAGQGAPVLLVGHGIMNRLIARELLALGWAGPAKPASQHWGASVYGLPARR